MSELDFTMDRVVGQTPLVALQHLAPPTARVLLKLEGQNPAGSVKDRPALWMIRGAEARSEIAPGDTLIEATSGNTGIALAMAASIRGMKLTLVIPADMSEERKQVMAAYGATLVEVDGSAGMEGARDVALRLQDEGHGRVLDQFSNPDGPRAHYETTGPEIWRDTLGAITHFVSSMGTTGTIMGVSRALKERNPAVQIVGVHPAEGARIPGIRRWSADYVPAIFEPSRVDEIREVDAPTAYAMARQLAREEGIFAGISSGGAAAIALQIARENPGATVVSIACDRGDRYLSTGLFARR
jgi:cysteine synthase B